MDTIWFFLNGFLIGIAIAAPVGPIALLCIKRTLLHGGRIGISTGLGAATADSLYGTIAVLGISTIIDFINGHNLEFRIFGGFVLILLALHAYKADPHDITKSPDAKSVLSAFVSGFFLTLTNPLTLIAFLTAFAAFGIGGEDATKKDTITLIGGVLAGSSIWWLFLNSLILFCRKKVSARLVGIITKSSAIGILIIAMYVLITGIIDLIAHSI